MRANLKPILPDDEQAEEVALEVLIWLAQKLDLMARFLKLTGIPGEEIREMIGRRTFYANLLAFITNHEPTLADFCHDCNQQAAWIEACTLQFSEAIDIHWT
jgi:hypothetical protein